MLQMHIDSHAVPGLIKGMSYQKVFSGTFREGLGGIREKKVRGRKHLVAISYLRLP